MAIRKCPDCKFQLSDKALACPCCGRQLGLWAKAKNITINDLIQLGIFFVLFSTVIVLYLNLQSFKRQLKTIQDQLEVAQEQYSLSVELNRPLVGVKLVSVKGAPEGPLERKAKNDTLQKIDVFDINYTIMNFGKYIAENVSL